MMRTTITLPNDLAAALVREARRRDTSVSEVVRTALSESLGLSGGRRRLPIAGLGRSGHRHTARDAEKILAKEWGKIARRR
jgi:Arc/MetJ-type ribon-helix-helix transcriptional regulator